MSFLPVVSLWTRAYRCAPLTTLLCIAALTWTSWTEAQPSAANGTRMLDRFDDLAAWTASASDGVKASIHLTAGIEAAQGVGAGALRLDFDLAGTAGYALAARSLPLELPANYELLLWIRADAPTNDLQIKLIDASGDNVWWFHRRNFEFPREWGLLRIRKRQIDFAWGPTADRDLRHPARLEFVVAAGGGGGAGSIYFSRLALHELPVDPATWPPPSAHASSHLPGADAALAIDGDPSTAWRSDPASGSAQTLTIDLGLPRDLGGFMVRWREGAYASRFDVQLSDDGEQWQTVRSITDARGGPAAISLTDARTRFVRLALLDGPGKSYGIADIDIEDPAFGESPNAFFEAVARNYRRGYFPRAFSGEQTYWTVVGVDGGAASGLLSEDGTLEVASAGFSIEPFVVENSRVVTWADVAATQSLADGYLPLPMVTWTHPDWQLHVSAFAPGTRADSRLIARYDIVNTSDRPISLRLVLALRPFQVNPPTQFLSVEGGVSRIHDIAWNGTAMSVDGEARIYPLRAPDRLGIGRFDDGPVPAWLETDTWPKANEIREASGYASAALGYDVELVPNAGATFGLIAPLSGRPIAPPSASEAASAWLAREQEGVVATWRGKLDRTSFDVPPPAVPLIDAMRTALAHLLIIRDGPILRPGPRSYARSWIRDGAMMSDALLRLGHADAAVDYLRWFAPYQFADGKIPCCVDARGADPVAENDSDGEFVFLADEAFRYTRDRTLQTAMWPHVVAAMRHLDALRRSGRGVGNLTPERRAFYGLLPASISHEGYSAKPMHSYWDDFWAMHGYDAAIDLAQAAGATGEVTQWQAARRVFGQDVRASLQASMAAHRISYLPGAAELGDFDPTSTAIAFAPAAAILDPASPAAQATYERYWSSFVDRREGRTPWNEFTPYELRIVGTFVRLGWPERAHELLDYFLAARRPLAWNQWAEVVGRSYRQPRFIGDMPHGWIASDFIRSVLDLFAYERDLDHSLVLGAGLPSSWLDGPGVAVHELRTRYGRLSYSLRKNRGRTTLRIDAGSGLPPGGFVFVAPGNMRLSPASINGRPTSWRGRELRIRDVPATVVLGAR